MRRRTALATLGALCIARGSEAASSGVPVLMYHTVSDTVSRNAIWLGLTLPTARFEAQLRYLEQHRIPTMTAGELVAALERGEHPSGVVLTFDDGYLSFATIIAPLLERYHARATFFVNSGSIGTPNHISWKQLRALHVAGHEIGAHGAHHRDLTTLDLDGQRREAGGCIEKIAQYGGFRPITYAYASGQYNATTLALMPTLGIRSAWTERYGRVRDLHARYAMPRLRISRETTLDEFAALVS